MPLAAAWLVAVAFQAHAGPGKGRIVRADAPSKVVLRGDFERPDVVVVGVTGSFPSTLRPLVSAASGSGPVHLLVQRGVGRHRVKRWVAGFAPAVRDAVVILEHESDSAWVRDFGPLQLRRTDGSSVWLDMAYPERPRDDVVPGVLGERMRVPVTSGKWSLDGGALAANGAGICVSTLEYTAEHKIPTVGHAARRELLPAIGCRVLALVPALPEEPTHHADLFVQFLAEDLVAVASVDPDLDPDAATRLDRAAATIARAASTLGRDLEVVRPPLGVDVDGGYLSYLNGLRLGDTFLMPTYDAHAPAAERAARATLEAAVPGLQVVRIPAAEVAELGGAVHCIALGLFR